MYQFVIRIETLRVEGFGAIYSCVSAKTSGGFPKCQFAMQKVPSQGNTFKAASWFGHQCNIHNAGLRFIRSPSQRPARGPNRRLTKLHRGAEILLSEPV